MTDTTHSARCLFLAAEGMRHIGHANTLDWLWVVQQTQQCREQMETAERKAFQRWTIERARP